MKRTTLAAVACLVLLVTNAAEASRTNRFELSDLGKLVSISDPQISSDGKSIAVLISRANYARKRYDSELVLVETATKAQRTLTCSRPGLASPRWSPSGDRLAFLAKGSDNKEEKVQLFVMPMNGGDALRLTTFSNDVQHFAWQPGGKALAFVVADEPESRGQIEKGEDGFEIGNDSFLINSPATPSHIWLVSAEGGPPRRLTSGAWSVARSLSGVPPVPLSWSPDGKSMAFARQATAHPGDTDQIAAHVLNVANGAIKPLTGRTSAESWPAYSPDGSAIAYSYWRDGLFLNSVSEVHVTRCEGGEGKNLTRPLDRDVVKFLWMPDGKSLLVAANDGTRVSMWIQPIEGAARRLVLGEINPDGAYNFEVTVGKEGSIAFVGSGCRRPQELYYMSSPEAKPQQLTAFNDSVAKLALAKAEVVEWDGPNGWHQNGLLYYPPDFAAEKKYPLVLRIHGGPQWASTQVFDEWTQLIASRGYLVFRPNYRGSDNMGNAYEVAIVNDAGDGPGRDVMAGLAAVTKRGLVDESRIAVTGWSYGGYMTVWLIGHYQVWKTAIAGAAVTDNLDAYYLSDFNVQWRYAFGGSPWTGELAKAYMEQSPIAYAGKIRTPTLIMSNMGDERVPITQSFKLYHALRENNVPVKFIAYPTGGHWPEDPVRTRDIYRRWNQWLDQYLTAPVSPTN